MKNALRNFILTLIVLSLPALLYNHAHSESPELDTPAISPDESATSSVPPANTKDMEEYLKSLVLQPGTSCIDVSCHAEMAKKKYIHAIGVDGMKCSRCHKTLTEGKHDFKKIPTETMTLCAECHRAEVLPPEGLIKTPPKVISDDEAKALHKPFAEGKCTACHDAHSSNYYKHLKLPYPKGIYALYNDNTYGLCIECHKDHNKVMTEPRILTLTMFRNGNVNLHFRHVNKQKGRSCKVCHHPHGTKKPGLIKETFLFGERMLTIDFEKTETGGKCSTSCHREAKYDRYKPEFNFIKTEPLPGEDATEDELERSRKDDLKRLEEKAGDPGNNK